MTLTSFFWQIAIGVAVALVMMLVRLFIDSRRPEPMPAPQHGGLMM